MAAGKTIEAHEAEQFARETLLSSSRTRPVVALTTSTASQQPWIDPLALAEQLGDLAEVVVIPTGDPTWALSAALPRRLDVFGGAARIWWTGLNEESNPFDHPLILIHDALEGERARRRILAAIVDRDESAGRWGAWTPRSERSPIRTTPSANAQPSERAEAWRRISEEYRVGDVVPGRVFRVDRGFVLVELLPGAGVIVPLAEIDYTWVRDPAEILKVGERVNVELLELDPPAGRGVASIKRALLASPREGISLRPGEPPYLGTEDATESEAHLRRALQRDRETLRQQGEELEAALEDRQRLAQHNEELKVQCASLRKELRSAEDRHQAFEARIGSDVDPLASENAFLAAVRVEHARRCDEADRIQYALARMRVGRAFLRSVRVLEGLDLGKVIEVCAQVASGRAHEIHGRALHELFDGASGRPIVRAADDAKAWRCALQVGSPSARRLHWWAIPGAEGITIEFASVAVHDEFSIPE
jgi:predicted RNA-binding protein with RPS1 domain